MVSGHIYCCHEKVTCNSYINDGLIKLEEVECGVEDLSDRYNGTCCIFLLKGLLNIKKGEQELTLTTGEMCCVSGEGIRMESVKESELVIFTSELPTEYYNKMVQELPSGGEEKQDELTKLEIRPPLDKCIEFISVCLKSGINCRHWFEEKQQELLVLLTLLYAREELAIFLHPQRFGKEADLKKFILEHCLRVKNTQNLADLCGFPISKFKRIFKEMFHESVYRWMLQQKAAYLKVALLNKDVNLKVLISDLGFSSPAHFTKFCKQWLGMVPTQYMKSHQENFEFQEVNYDEGK